MPRKMVEQSDIIKMNELYQKLGTYAAVAREVGFSPTTVKKYIIQDFIPEDKTNRVVFSGTIIPTKEISKVLKYPQKPEDWKFYLSLSDEEKEEIIELQKEIIL